MPIKVRQMMKLIADDMSAAWGDIGSTSTR